MATTLTLLYDRIRWDEKELLKSARSKGIDVKEVDVKNVIFNLNESRTSEVYGEVVLQRCISHTRGTYASACLESKGLRVLNKASVSEVCGNKLWTTLMLIQAGVPTPKTAITFTPESALKAAEEIGYPVVLKPLVGSWGRMVVALRDKEEAEAVIELRSQLNGPLNQIFYVQEKVKRPPRDIRCIVIGERLVAAVYRVAAAGEWRTNVARGGTTEPCPISKELEEIALKAAEAVGGGVLGVDMMESPNGLLVHEVNSTVEFRGAQSASSVSIADAIIDYALELIRR
ncbi:MAG: lysine biosynthesis protein LysX [Nitrososphaerales archaeon]